MKIDILKSYKFWFAIGLLVVFAAARLSPIENVLSLETLRVFRADLTSWVDSNTVLASIAYVVAYIFAAMLALPGAAILSLAGGFLFGATYAAVLIAVGATTGATLVFLLARSLFGESVMKKVVTQYPQLVDGIRKNAWSYLLVMRLIPLFPFALVNLAAAVVGVSLITYLLTTFFGMMPGIVVYALSGAGLGTILDQRSEFSISSVFTPTIIAALTGLSVLSLLAIFIRKRFERRT